jgi:hypothetical protein
MEKIHAENYSAYADLVKIQPHARTLCKELLLLPIRNHFTSVKEEDFFNSDGA